MTRLLVYTPTYGDGPRPETLAAIAAQEFDGELIHEVSWHNPHAGEDGGGKYAGGDLRNVTAQYQRGRQMMLDGDYDGLLCIEHDIVPPPHAAQTLWDDGGPVVYGVYLFRGPEHLLNVCEVKDGRPGPSISFDVDALEYYRLARRAEVGGIGLGCTLIQRIVLEHIEFREAPDHNPPDIPFAIDCIRLDVPQIARFDVPCGHYDGERLLEPYTGEDIAVRGWALKPVTYIHNGRSRLLLRNRYHTLPATVALRLAADGYIRVRGLPDYVQPAENLTYAD